MQREITTLKTVTGKCQWPMYELTKVKWPGCILFQLYFSHILKIRNIFHTGSFYCYSCGNKPTRQIHQEFLKQEEQSTTHTQKEVPPTKNELDAFRYLRGYLVKNFIKNFKNHKNCKISRRFMLNWWSWPKIE